MLKQDLNPERKPYALDPKPSPIALDSYDKKPQTRAARAYRTAKKYIGIGKAGPPVTKNLTDLFQTL